MKKYILLFLILLSNIHFYGNIITDNVLFKTKDIDSLFINVNNNLLKSELKNKFHGFYVRNGFHMNSFSKLKPSTLFFAGGDILDEDFEAASGWAYTNAAKGNKWVIGTAVNNGGTKSLYVSKDDGVSYVYDTNSATIVHAYKEISIAVTTLEISVSFDWKCLGEGTEPKKHYFNAWIVPDAFVPMLDKKITEVKGKRILLGSFNNNSTAFKNEFIEVDVDSLKGKKAKIVFEWINDTIGGWQPPAAIDNIKISTVKCSKPSNITFEDIKADSVLMKWDASAETTAEYDIYYSKDDTAPTADTIPIKSGIKTTSYLLDKLDSSSNYYVWIRSVCGTNKGRWTKMYNFITECGIVKIPFWEGFNSNSPSSKCWTITDANKDSFIWVTNTYSWNAFEGNGSKNFSNSNDTTVNDDWLISPTIKMNGTYRLKYHYKVSGYGTNEFEVLLSKDGTETKEFKQSLVAKKMYNNGGYIKKTVILYNIVGDVNIAWHAYGKGGSVIYIDNIIIEDIETCPEPMDLDVKDIETDRVKIFWKDDFGGKKWEYYVQEAGEGSPADTDSGTSTTKKEVVVSKDVNGDNLESNTDYEYYVRTACEDGKYSIWSGPFDFRTECDVLTIPFWEGFNADSDYIYCWDIEDGNDDNVFWVNSYGGFEGNLAVSFNKLYGYSSVVHDDWLISPALKMNGTYRLKYHYKVRGSGEFEVLLSKDGKKIKDFIQTLVAKKTYINEKYLEKTVILDNIVGDVNIAWHANGKGKTQIYIDNVFIEEVEGCPEPLELGVKDVKYNKATILWTDEFGANNWEYFVQAEGKGEPTKNGTVSTKKENIATMDNDVGGTILDNKDYEFYVRTVCGGGENSIWSGPFKFTTLCAPFTTPFWEGFNSDSKSISCWSIIDENKDGVSWKNGSVAFEGDRAMYFNKSYSDSTFVNNDWLISPTIKLNGTYRLKYHYKVSGSGSNEFEVLLSKDGTKNENFKQTLVAKKTYNNLNYIEKTVIINNIVGDINIAWHVNGKGNSQIYIDNIIIEEIETCPEPVELAVKNMLTNKATILWEDESGGKKWEYFVQDSGKGEPTKSGTISSNIENDITTENENGSTLLQNTEYEFYARTVCEDGENSIWSGPFVFRTLCGVFDLPFWEGFNKDSETIYCWNIIDKNKDNVFWETTLSGFFEGNQAVYFNKYSSDTTFVNDDWLISPTFKMNGTYRLKYHYKVSDSGSNDFEVLLSKDGVKTEDFKQTVVSKKNYNNNTYIEKIVFLNNVVGNINIAWHTNGKGSSTVYIDNVIIEEVESCPEPIDLGVKDVLKNKATILWSDESDGKSWEYFVQTAGKGSPSKKGVITSKKENEITKETDKGTVLLSNTEYEFYVRTICDDGENSVWSGPFVFRIACDVLDLPFWEGFNRGSETIYCWETIDGNNDKSTWTTTSEWGVIYEKTQAMCFKKQGSSTIINDDWLISPTVKTNGGTYRIKFHYKANSYNDNEFEILMSTKGIDVKDFTETILAKKVYKNNSYEEKVVFVDNLNGDVNFAWHITNIGTSTIYLDNVFIEKVKGCPEPYYINIIGQTDNTISIEWEQSGDGSKWEVIAVPYGEEIPDEKDLKPIIVDKYPLATITGLDSGKVYTFYVRVVCKDGTYSDWSTGKNSSTYVKANNNCSGAYNIPINNGSDCILSTSGTFLGSTLSSVTKGDCGDPGKYGSLTTDVWFEFTATSESHVLNVSDLIGTSYGAYFGLTFVLYGDDCTASDNPIMCFPVFNVFLSLKKLTDLKVGKKYYFRVYSHSSNSDYSFKVCMTTPEPNLHISPSGEDYSVEELVKNVLIDSNCDLVSNIKYQAGDNTKINTFGYFGKQKHDFPFEKGIVLATHAVNEVPGPYTGGNLGKVPAWVGDPDLNDVIDQVGGAGFGSQKYVSVLEFDFIPIKDSIKFEYIFASESYLYYCGVVCDPGGALFAAWLTEEATGIGQNLATVPGTNEPIALNTIRDTKKTGAPCESIKPQFFGEYYSDYIESSSKAPINYAGVTVPMTSKKVAVNVGKKYHIKIAIADFCPNPRHVSAVFFNGGSFDLGNLDLGADMLVSTNTALCEETEKTIYSGLDKKQANIKWYKDGNLIQGENDSKLIVVESGDYEVVGSYDFINCEVKGNVRVEMYPDVIPNSPEDIVFCVNSISGKQFMDITTNEKIMLNGLNTEDFQFFYYLTKEDSEKDENLIENPTEFEIPKDKKSKEIYTRVVYNITGCEKLYKFSLVPQKITVSELTANQQACARYIFKELPTGQHYFTEKGAKGREYRAGDIIDKPGSYTIYICSITGDCYEEVSFDLEITAPVKAKVFSDKTMQCVNYDLEELPSGNRYFTEPNAQGVELFPGNTIRFTQTIYVYAKSDIGPDYCTDQSSFTLTFEECPIPKGISPNGDGVNDFLDLEVHGVTSIIIYNRYGAEVYSSSSDYTNQWYGQSNSGNALPDGTYYYVIEARGKTRTGWIQVSR